MISPTPSRLAALLIVAPAVLAACWLTWFEIALDRTSVNPGPAQSMSAALATDSIEEAFAHIRSGQDPNAPVPIRHDTLTGAQDIMLTPLLIAVAFDRSDSVLMLLSSGVRLEAPGNRFAVCLAKRMGHEAVAGWLVRYGGAVAAAAPCPEMAPPADAPLRAYAE